MLHQLLLQVVTPNESPIGSTAIQETIHKETSMVEMLSSMGAVGIGILLIIFILSAISLFVFIERLITLGKASNLGDGFMESIRNNILNGNVNAAKDSCLRSAHPAARVVEKGITKIGRNMRDIETAMENTGRLEVFKLEKNLGFLVLVSRLAPLLGFVGTIIGVIKIFYDVSNAGGALELDVLSGGLYAKMMSSAAGLILGIFSFLCYHILNRKIEKITNVMERCSLDFVDVLQEPAK